MKIEAQAPFTTSLTLFLLVIIPINNMHDTVSLLKRDTITLFKRESSNKYSLYVFAIIVGCIAVVLIGGAIFTMYKGTEEENYYDMPYEQRKYMREVRQRNLNGLAIAANRPDMIIPVEELNY